MNQPVFRLVALTVVVAVLLALRAVPDAHVQLPQQTALTSASSPLELPWPAGTTHNPGISSAGCSYDCPPGHLGNDYYAVDWNLASGSSVAAVLGGTIHFTYDSCGGNIAWIDHGGGLISYYGHLGSYASGLSDGSAVTAGQLIAYSDNTGSCTTGPHLHFSMHYNATTWFNGSAFIPEPMAAPAWATYAGFGSCGASSYLHGNSVNCGPFTASGATAAPLVVDNGSITFVADLNHLRKFGDGGSGVGFLSGTDALGLTGPNCPTVNLNYHCVGYYDLGALITALAISSGNLYIGLSTGRVIETNMCGTGGNVCAFSDPIGSGSLQGYSYWIGEMDLAGPISALAVNSTNLFTSFQCVGCSTASRTVKTTLCGTGGNYCALVYNACGGACSNGSAGLSGYHYWVGWQQWVWPVVAQAANNSSVFTSLAGSGVYRTCKTDLGTSGGDVFWFASDPTDCTAGTAPHWQGWQMMSTPVVGLSADQKFVWWSLASTPRLIETDMCVSGLGAGNICAFSDGYGTGGISGFSDWQGRQDWCAGYVGSAVTTWNFLYQGVLRSLVNTSVSAGSGLWRIVKGNDYPGVNMFTTNCAGTTPSNGWQGSQDFNF